MGNPLYSLIIDTSNMADFARLDQDHSALIMNSSFSMLNLVVPILASLTTILGSVSKIHIPTINKNKQQT